jgi:PKD repeat protein
VTTSFPSTIARRTLISTFTLLLLVLSVFAASAHAIPTNTGGNDDPPLPPNPAPTARFTISPNPALVSELPVLTQAKAAKVDVVEAFGRNPVTFNAASSSDVSPGHITKYQWDLDGNGSYETDAGTAKSTKRSYSQPGSYTIHLKVTDNGGRTDIETHTLVVHRRPVAKLTASAPVAVIGDTVAYSANGSSDDNGIANVSFDLDGDGTFETTNGTFNASRSYGSIGKRTVKVRVTDVYGAQSTASVDVLIHRAPTAAFTAAPSPAFVGEQVTFDGSSSSDDESVAKYEWDLDGNGTFETNGAANPKTTHTYTQPGTIKVALKVTDNRGVADISTRSLTVEPKRVVTDKTAPKVRILTSTAKMSKKGIVAIKVSCPRTERLCSGRLALRQLGVRASKASLGGKALKLGGGQTATLRVKLSKTKQRLVRRNGSIRAQATARVKDAAGNTGTATKRLKIKR